MLSSLSIKNFTAFTDANFTFCNGLNAIVGENASGKTHVLKLAYCSIAACNQPKNSPANPTKSILQSSIANKLIGVFMPDELGRLARRNRQGRQRSEVVCNFSSRAQRLEFSFHTASKSEVAVGKSPAEWIEKVPVYLPTRELLTIYPNFVSIYETSQLEFEETWRDTCILLGAALAKGPREKTIRHLLPPLEQALGGTVELSRAGRFYLNVDGVQVEMPLVAEGLRKFAMVARLIATGSLSDKGCLFWDEPEANLNPRIIKIMARTILELCSHGLQVFIASHSLFLLRELDILLRTPEFAEVPHRFFGLQPSDDGVRLHQGDTVDDIGEITALQEELSQSDRYLQAEVEARQ